MIVNKLTNRDELELSVHTTPAPSFSPIVDPTLPSPSKHSLPSVTRIVKGHSGKTVVQNVVDVEDDVLSDEQDGFIISDNVEMTDYTIKDTGFLYSDHQPVFMKFKLK